MTPAIPYRFGPRRGDVVTVRQARGSRRLPEGLAEGDRLRLVVFEHGFWDRENDEGMAKSDPLNAGYRSKARNKKSKGEDSRKLSCSAIPELR